MVCTTAVAHLNSDQVASRRRSFFFGFGSQKHQGIAGGVEVMCKSEMFCIAVHAKNPGRQSGLNCKGHRFPSVLLSLMV